ncbi:MAG: PrsW family intramembrane metalloprotease [Syntrophobacteraceae bacterium]|nr:PrsW family intramembrane metalloprotease [Syntrophobacteraceae bacterium]
MAFIVSMFLAFSVAILMVLFVYWLDRYEKEPFLLLLGAFLWGVVVAFGGAFILNTVFNIGMFVFTGDEAVSLLATGTLSAPLVEEGLKGLALLIVMLLFRKEFDSILDGIIYAGMVALGFAASENVLYMVDRGFNMGGWPALFDVAWTRLVVIAWVHPFFTAFTGIGLALARLNRNILIKIIATLGGFALAVLAHFLHNGLAFLTAGWLVTLFDWFGWFVMALFIVWMIYHERSLLKKHLREEVTSGVINEAQFQKALSPLTLSIAGLSGRAASRFFLACGELAHKKEQFARLGEEGGNSAIIETLRKQLAALAPQVK